MGRTCKATKIKKMPKIDSNKKTKEIRTNLKKLTRETRRQTEVADSKIDKVRTYLVETAKATEQNKQRQQKQKEMKVSDNELLSVKIDDATVQFANVAAS